MAPKRQPTPLMSPMEMATLDRETGRLGNKSSDSLHTCEEGQRGVKTGATHVNTAGQV